VLKELPHENRIPCPRLPPAPFSSAALADVSALASVTQLDSLYLFEIGLTDLNGLSGLTSVRNLVNIYGNTALVDATGVGALQTTDSLLIRNNPLLKTLPSFANFTSQPSTIAIRDNALLEHVVLDFVNAPTPTYNLRDFGAPASGGTQVELGIDVIDISNNASLQSISVPAGLSEAQLFVGAGNPSLTSIDFGNLRELGQLSLVGNAQLSQVELGALASVSFLQVKDNPLLTGATFDDISAFAREISGNAE